MPKHKRPPEPLHNSLDLVERGPCDIGPPPTVTQAENRALLLEAIAKQDLSLVTPEARQQMYEQARRQDEHQSIPDQPAHDPVVYYMRVGNRIKIGYTANLKRRVEALGPEEVLATEPGSVALEKQRHREFMEYHVHREWFAQGPRLLAHIVRLRGGKA